MPPLGGVAGKARGGHLLLEQARVGRGLGAHVGVVAVGLRAEGVEVAGHLHGPALEGYKCYVNRIAPAVIADAVSRVGDVARVGADLPEPPLGLDAAPAIPDAERIALGVQTFLHRGELLCRTAAQVDLAGVINDLPGEVPLGRIARVDENSRYSNTRWMVPK